MYFLPIPLFLFIFSNVWLSRASHSSEVAQKEIQAVTPPLSPLLQSPAEILVKSYTTLNHSIGVNTTYIRIYSARENYVP